MGQTWQRSGDCRHVILYPKGLSVHVVLYATDCVFLDFALLVLFMVCVYQKNNNWWLHGEGSGIQSVYICIMISYGLLDQRQVLLLCRSCKWRRRSISTHLSFQQEQWISVAYPILCSTQQLQYSVLFWNQMSALIHHCIFCSFFHLNNYFMFYHIIILSYPTHWSNYKSPLIYQEY